MDHHDLSPALDIFLHLLPSVVLTLIITIYAIYLRSNVYFQPHRILPRWLSMAGRYLKNHRCCKCMMPLEKGDRCKTLPACQHTFHCDCLNDDGDGDDDDDDDDSKVCPKCHTPYDAQCSTELVPVFSRSGLIVIDELTSTTIVFSNLMVWFVHGIIMRDMFIFLLGCGCAGAILLYLVILFKGLMIPSTDHSKVITGNNINPISEDEDEDLRIKYSVQRLCGGTSSSARKESIKLPTVSWLEPQLFQLELALGPPILNPNEEQRNALMQLKEFVGAIKKSSPEKTVAVHGPAVENILNVVEAANYPTGFFKEVLTEIITLNDKYVRAVSGDTASELNNDILSNFRDLRARADQMISLLWRMRDENSERQEEVRSSEQVAWREYSQLCLESRNLKRQEAQLLESIFSFEDHVEELDYRSVVEMKEHEMVRDDPNLHESRKANYLASLSSSIEDLAESLEARL